MQEHLFLKEDFIYKKKNSITKELCIDIIEIFENDVSNNLCNCDNMEYNPQYTTIKQYLKKELKRNIHDYEKEINKIKGYKMFHIEKCNFVFHIGTNNTSNSTISYINRVSVDSTDVKLLMFIWFLNDYDGEIIFWNEHRIIPEVGKCIIFPISWCFPHKELINLQTKKYIIYGYIYI